MAERNESSAAYSPADQWRGLYAGRPEEQKLVNTKALTRLIEERNRLAETAAALAAVVDECVKAGHIEAVPRV